MNNPLARTYTRRELDQLTGEMRLKARLHRVLREYHRYRVWARRHHPRGEAPVTALQMNALREYIEASIQLGLIPDEQQGTGGTTERTPVGPEPYQPPAQTQTTPISDDASMIDSGAA